MPAKRAPLWPWIMVLAALALILISPVLAQPRNIIAADDVLTWFYPIKTSMAAGNWNPYVNAGSPVSADSQSAAHYPVDMALLWLLPAHYALGVGFALHIFIAGLGVLLLCRRYRCSPVASALAGIAFMLSTFCVSHSYAGHYSMMAAVAWMPWTVLALDWALAKRSFAAGIVASVPLGLQLLAGHPQIALFTMLLLGAYTTADIVQLLLRKKVRDAIRLGCIGAAMVACAVLIGAAQLVPSVELAMHATRGGGVSYGFSTQYSLPFQNIITIIAPNAFGTPVYGSYMNEGAYHELPLYCGVLTLVLALAALICRRDKRVWFLLGAAVVSLLLAFGKNTPLFWLLWKVVPGINMFRAPARFGIIWTLAVCVLGGIGLDAVITKGKTRALRLLAAGTIAVAVLLGVGAAVLQGGHTTIASLIGPRIAAAYNALHIAMPLSTEAFVHGVAVDVAIAAFLLLLSGLLLVWRARRGPRHVGIAAVALLAVSLLSYGLPFIHSTPLEQAYAVPSYVNFLQSQPGLWRVHDVSGILTHNYEAIWGIQPTQGYNPTRLTAYQGLLATVDANLSKESLATLDLLNTRYIIAATPLHADGLTLVHQGDAYVYENENALPRAYIVPSIETAPTRTGVTEAQVVAYHADSMTIRAPADGILVMSELAYPGWTCSVNNGPGQTPLVAYDAFRAVHVRAGDNVDCGFMSTTASIGLALCALGCLLVIAALIWLARAR